MITKLGMLLSVGLSFVMMLVPQPPIPTPELNPNVIYGFMGSMCLATWYIARKVERIENRFADGDKTFKGHEDRLAHVEGVQIQDGNRITALEAARA